jgi:Domain of unknown function (DUF1906)/Putative peptidoglycan binding domain
MGLQGLDRAVAPPAATAKRMLDAMGGHWWNVYIGGPESGGHGWTPELVREYAEHDVDRFMLTYVGRQSRGPLNHGQGEADGRDAVAVARRFGYSGDVPLCLDVELPTFEGAPSQSVEYARGWCDAVRQAGARPGVYANPAPLEAMARGGVHADFVWIASWVAHGPMALDPHSARGFPPGLWSQPGERAWQYAGEFGNTRCQVLGLDVDISVADPGCLAAAPGRQPHPQAGVHAAVLNAGDAGPRVRRLTASLAFVRAPGTNRPYLNSARAVLDAAAENALRAFQHDHRLVVDGVYGPATAEALAQAVRRERVSRRHPLKPEPTAPDPPASPPAKLQALIHELERLEAATTQTWETLTAFAEERRRVVARLDGGMEPEARGASEETAILRRIEQSLDTLVSIQQRELGHWQQEAATPAAGAAATPTLASGAPQAALPAASEPAPQEPAGAVATATTLEVAPAPAPPGPPRPPVRLTELPEDELQARIDRLDRHLGTLRAVLIKRYVDVERRIAAVSPRQPAPPARPAPTPKPRKHPGRQGSGPNGTDATTPPGPVRRPKLPRARPPERTSHQVRELQRRLNEFTAHYLRGVGPLVVDGIVGHATRQRIRTAKFYLGYAGPEQRSARIPPGFERQLRRPKSARALRPGQISRGLARRRQQHKAAKRAAAPRAGVTTFDGVAVAAWLTPHLEWARAHGWKGTLQSGYRDPRYSEQLCHKICGAPTCRGRCAGKTSHHVGRAKPAGAIDVSDYVTFGRLMRGCPHSPRIFNNLPIDPVHYSSTGN